MMNLRNAILTALTALAGGPLLAQVGPTGPPLPGTGGAEQQAREEMIELFGKVEARLKEIDALLYEASAGQSGLAGSEEAVIGQLLQSSSTKSEEVLAGIDRILEIANQFGGEQGGGSCQSAMEQGGESPLEKPSSGAQGEKEETPEIGPQGQQPDQQQEQQPESQPGQEQPDSPRESLAPPENRDATNAPPQGETGRVETSDTAERWGDLPVHVRDLFRSEGGRDMPAQYRDWIDGYYRRLNKRR